MNLALVRVVSKCFGPESSTVINGRLISVEDIPERSILAFSAASLIRCIAILSPERSMPCSALKVFTM